MNKRISKKEKHGSSSKYSFAYYILLTAEVGRGFGNQVGEPQAHDPYSNINGPAYFFDIHLL